LIILLTREPSALVLIGKKGSGGYIYNKLLFL